MSGHETKTQRTRRAAALEHDAGLAPSVRRAAHGVLIGV
jgi:hypothetical protein